LEKSRNYFVSLNIEKSRNFFLLILKKDWEKAGTNFFSNIEKSRSSFLHYRKKPALMEKMIIAIGSNGSWLLNNLTVFTSFYIFQYNYPWSKINAFLNDIQHNKHKQ